MAFLDLETTLPRLFCMIEFYRTLAKNACPKNTHAGQTLEPAKGRKKKRSKHFQRLLPTSHIGLIEVPNMSDPSECWRTWKWGRGVSKTSELFSGLHCCLHNVQLCWVIQPVVNTLFSHARWIYGVWKKKVRLNFPEEFRFFSFFLSSCVVRVNHFSYTVLWTVQSAYEHFRWNLSHNFVGGGLEKTMFWDSETV